MEGLKRPAENIIVIKAADKGSLVFGIDLIIFMKPQDNCKISTYMRMLNSMKTYTPI